MQQTVSIKSYCS